MVPRWRRRSQTRPFPPFLRGLRTRRIHVSSAAPRTNARKKRSFGAASRRGFGTGYQQAGRGSFGQWGRSDAVGESAPPPRGDACGSFFDLTRLAASKSGLSASRRGSDIDPPLGPRFRPSACVVFCVSSVARRVVRAAGWCSLSRLVGQAKDGAAATRPDTVLQRQCAAVRLGDLAAEREADAGSGRLRGEERHEEVGGVGQPWTLV